MEKQIICIKVSSHSNFELYLLGEKYLIPYKFLYDCKMDKELVKIWIEVGNKNVLAVLERSKEKGGTFVPYQTFSQQEQQKIKSLTPIISGQIIRKYRGNIELKESEFKQKLEANETYKQEMLKRNYPVSNICCFNLKSTKDQLFALCVQNNIDFINVMRFKEIYGHLDLHRLWIEKHTSTNVAFSYLTEPCKYQSKINEIFEVFEEALIPKAALNQMSRFPLRSPKLKVSKESIEAYQKAKVKGYLFIDKFENISTTDTYEKLKQNSSFQDRIKNLLFSDIKTILDQAIIDEEYEFAAFLRDHLKKYEKK